MGETTEPEIDLASTFCSEDYDVVDWVNKHIDSRSTTLPRLDLLGQDLSDQLERAMSLILGSVPRVANEISQLQRDSASLKPTLTTLEESVSQLSSHSDGSDPIEVLEQLNTIKSNITSCCGILSQAANWDKLVREVDINFTTRNLTGVAAQLGLLRDSLTKLEGMPGQEGRKDIFERFEERLETLITPGLREALSVQDDMGPLQNYLQVFDRLGRRKVLVEEYAKSRCNRAQAIWEGVKALLGTTELERWLPRYLDEIVAVVNEESKRVVSVFGTSEELVSTLILVVRKLVQAATDPVAEVLSRESVMTSIVHLSIAFTTFEEFTGSVHQNIQQLVQAIASQSGDQELSLRHSDVLHLVSSCSSVIVGLMKRYAPLERSTLLSEYKQGSSSTLTSSDANIDSRVFQGLSRTDLLDILEQSVDRSITTGFGTKTGVALAESWSLLEMHNESLVNMLTSSEFVEQWNSKSEEERFSDCLQLLRQLGKQETRLGRSVAEFLPRLLRQCKTVSLFSASVEQVKENGFLPQEQDTKKKVPVIVAEEPSVRPLLLTFLLQGADLEEATRLVGTDGETQGELDRAFPGAVASFDRIACEVQRLGSQVLLSPLLSTLAQLTELKCWFQEGGAASEITSDGEKPTANDAPNDYIVTLGNLLTGDQFLSFLSQFGEAAASAGPSIAGDVTVRRFGALAGSFLEHHLRELEEALGLSQGNLMHAPFVQNAQSLEEVTQSWLSSCVRVLLCHIFQQVHRLPKLCVQGLAQLMIDCEYLSNVASSIGVPRDPLHIALVNASNALKQDIHAQGENILPKLTAELRTALKKLRN